MKTEDFKLDQLKEKVNNKEVLIPALIAYGVNTGVSILTSILTVVLLFSSGVGFFELLMSGEINSSSSLASLVTLGGLSSLKYLGVKAIIGTLLVFLVTLAGGLFVISGLTTSFKKYLETGKSGNFFENAIQNITKIAIYYAICFLAISLIPYLFGTIFSYKLVAIVGHLFIALPVFVYPLVYLCLFEGKPLVTYKTFVTDKAKLLGCIGLLYFVCSYLPLGNILIALANIILPLYIMILYLDKQKPSEEEIQLF